MSILDYLGQLAQLSLTISQENQENKESLKHQPDFEDTR